MQVASPAAADATRVWRREEAVAVAIDILDEDHSLAIAMRRLALDAALRAELGRAARRHWAAGHTVEHMAADYERAIAAAAAAPAVVRPSAPAGRCRRTPPTTAPRWPAASPQRSVWL